MSLKAGRVGVAPDQVDEFGKIKSEATSGYTKQEADAKFSTKDELRIAINDIDLLMASKLTDVYGVMGENGAKNIMSDEVHELSLSSGTVGAAAFGTDDPAVMFFCKVKQNTDYTISRKASTDANKRFTVVTSVNAPANGVSCNVIYANVNATSYTFNSGNNNYVALYCGKNLTDTDIEPMLCDARDTNPDFEPYAMTNRELTEKVVLKGTFSGTTTANGNIEIYAGTDREILNVVADYTANQCIMTPYRTNDAIWAHVRIPDSSGSVRGNFDVTGEYYYIQL